ncbi:hypothetical protein [Aquimarina sp. AD1]|uniref:hypothetical protein n=2 Tax=Aquimarina sp. (strain AD1) TaxID=1714848 RepID=UPI000EA9D814|nr:hypothetical protein [Aquimarina sp. AD1]
MNILKTIMALLICFTVTTNAVSQSDSQRIKTKTTKTFEFKKDGKTIPYRITVYKTSKTPLKLKKADKGKLNQGKKEVSTQVTKLIYVDNDVWSDYDKYIVLRYNKDPSDSFELKQTEKGFKVIVDNKNVEYIFGEGVYFVNNEDRDFFFVDEFDTI